MITVEEFKKLDHDEQMTAYLDVIKEVQQSKKETTEAAEKLANDLARLSNNVNNLLEYINDIKEKAAASEAEYNSRVASLTEAANAMVQKCTAISNKTNDRGER